MKDHDVLSELLKDPKALHVAILLLRERQDKLEADHKSLVHRVERILEDVQLADTEIRDKLAEALLEYRVSKEQLAQTRASVALMEERMYQAQGEGGDWAAKLTEWAVRWWWIVLPALFVIVVVLAKTGILEKLIRLFL